MLELNTPNEVIARVSRVGRVAQGGLSHPPCAARGVLDARPSGGGADRNLLAQSMPDGGCLPFSAHRVLIWPNKANGKVLLSQN